ncbi:copper resistance D family protein [Marinicella gelatinilytica]|uniref:copper resistance D family protein n=1 Tax=Marinicella gelatinilytica TaxID=2996017 RepID=UPI002260F7F1|nr:CopD family protein [Marinicella gelatinilytica]MCX7543870.1 CopD family protein [Marinicella gelatinilytica]
MPSSIWEIATLVTKLLIYAGFAQAVAIPFIAVLCRFNHSILNQLKKVSYTGLFLALLATTAYFFIQVAVFAENGLSGAFDQFYIELIWHSGVGEMTVWRASAVIMSLLSLVLIYRHVNNPNQRLLVLSMIIYTLNLFVIGLSFTASGHVSELSSLAHFAIGLHVLMAFGWLGSLWPLIIICRTFKPQAVAHVMHRFGQIALIMVALLIAAGGYLAFNLIVDFNALANTNYGQLFSLKLILVFHILLLATFHKFILVPGLLKARKSKQSLAGSIKAELNIGLAILIVTAVLTTFVGPASH